MNRSLIFVLLILCVSSPYSSAKERHQDASLEKAEAALNKGAIEDYRREIDEYSASSSSLPWRWGNEILKVEKIEYLRYALENNLRPSHDAYAIHADWLCRAVSYNNPEAISALVKAGFNIGAYTYVPQDVLRMGTCTKRGAIIEAIRRDNIELFKAFFDGEVSPDTTWKKKPILLALIEENKIEHARFLLEKGATVDLVYKDKALIEYAESQEMISLLERFGGIEKLKDSAHLKRAFGYYLQHNPIRARNIAISVEKSSPPYGKYLLGLYYEAEAKKRPEPENLGDLTLALISFREAGELGSPDALVKVAEYFEKGSVVSANEEISTEFYFLALARKSGIAQARLIEKGKLSAPRPISSTGAAVSEGAAPVVQRRAATSTGSGVQAVKEIFGFLAGAYLYSQGLQAQQAQATAQTRQAVRAELNTWSEAQRLRSQAMKVPPQVNRNVDFSCRPDLFGTTIRCNRY